MQYDLGKTWRFGFLAMFFLAAVPAWAANEAGPAPGGGGTLVADGDNVPATDTPTHINPADGEGIFYSVTESFSLYVRDNVSTIQTNTANGYGIGQVSTGGTGDTFNLLIDTTDPTPVSISTSGADAYGIFASKDDSNSSGNVSVISAGSITTSGTNGWGIFARHAGTGGLQITSSGTINTSGTDGYAIRAMHTGTGDITLNSLGSLITTGTNGWGMYATHSGLGNITVNSNGSITTSGTNGYGIRIQHSGGGSVTINSNASIVTGGTDAWGISGEHSLLGDVLINSNATINTSGDGAYAIRALHSGVGDATVNSNAMLSTSGDNASAIRGEHSGTGGLFLFSTANILTQGNGAMGIDGLHSGTGNLEITNSSTITTGGVNSSAIRARHQGDGVLQVNSSGAVSTGDATAIFAEHQGDGLITITTTGSITTTNGSGIWAARQNGTGNIRISQQGTITAGGSDVAGIDAWVSGTGFIGTPGPGSVTIDALADITAQGQGSAGIRVRHFGPDGTLANPQDISLTISQSVSGGWGNLLTPGAGVYIQRQGGNSPITLTIQAGGSVGALSDLAIGLNSDLNDSGITIENSGTITGYINLALGAGGGDDVLNNYSSNSFNLRNFYDSDGDGVRDTEGVAVSDFGPGNDLFNNTISGTLRLSTVTGATNFDPDMAYVPPGHTARSLSVDGVEHGALVNLETFINSGVIDMQDARTGGTAPVWGDRLVITGNSSVTAGMTSGGGVFRSNGGLLMLDTVLNDGTNDQTDVLVIDRAELAPGGPTGVRIDVAGGNGGITGNGPTDGILVINALDMAGSDPGAFDLDTPVAGGPFQYDLVAGTNGWYLQTVAITPGAMTVALAPVLFREPLGLHGRESLMLPNQQPWEAYCFGAHADQPRWDVAYSFRDGMMDATVWSGSLASNGRIDWDDRRIYVAYTTAAYGNWRAGVAGHARWFDITVDNQVPGGVADTQAQGIGVAFEVAWASGGWTDLWGLVVAAGGNFTRWTDISMYDSFTQTAAQFQLTNWSMGIEAVYYVPVLRRLLLAPRGQMALYGNSGESFLLNGFNATLGGTTWLAGRFGAALHGPVLPRHPWLGSWMFFTDFVYNEEFPYNATVAGFPLGAYGAAQWFEYGTRVNVNVAEHLTLFFQLRGANKTASLDYEWVSLGMGGQLVW